MQSNESLVDSLLTELYDCHHLAKSFSRSNNEDSDLQTENYLSSSSRISDLPFFCDNQSYPKLLNMSTLKGMSKN